MTIPRKQLKITKLFKKGATKLPEDCDDLQVEIQQLVQKLRDKQHELFQLQRNSYRHKLTQPKSKADVFVRPPKIVLQNSVDSLKRSLELIAMLSSTEVQSYVANNYCCIIFHMQHKSEHYVKHGLKINMNNGVNELSAGSLPPGFNLKAVMEDYDNVMKPECLGAIRKALFAYHDRLEQYQMLQNLVNIEADLFKTLDGSHIEITLDVYNERDEEGDQCSITLLLDYRVYDIRPKNYAIKEDSALTEDAADLLREQCAVFKKKPLNKAFKSAFIDGVGPFKLVQDNPMEEERPPRSRKRAHQRHTQNDETFHPEDCSDISDEEQQ